MRLPVSSSEIRLHFYSSEFMRPVVFMLSLSHENSYYQVRIASLVSTSAKTLFTLGFSDKRPRFGII